MKKDRWKKKEPKKLKHPKCTGCLRLDWCMLTLAAHIEMCQVMEGEEVKNGQV